MFAEIKRDENWTVIDRVIQFQWAEESSPRRHYQLIFFFFEIWRQNGKKTALPNEF